MKPTLPALLAINGGYVDAAGFVALQGLFTAHVTGNFVTLGAALVFGSGGVVAKLLALPVFCAVVAAVRVAGRMLAARGHDAFGVLLAVQAILLAAGGAFAVKLGPFPEGDTWQAILTGMTLVAGMAVQNAAQRVHLPGAPPSTLMTGNTTQVVIDFVDLARGTLAPADKARCRRMAITILCFAVGCAAAALIFHLAGMACFLPPIGLTLLALWMRGDAGVKG